MSKGPRGEKRPADVIGAAVLAGKIATGEASETVTVPETLPRRPARNGLVNSICASRGKRGPVCARGAVVAFAPTFAAFALDLRRGATRETDVA